MDNQNQKLGDIWPLDDLERQVAEAKAELAQYQGLLNELPNIYEDKFRHKVHSLAEEIRHLLGEQKALQVQASRALDQSRAPEALPPAAVVSPFPAPAYRKWADVRLPSFPSPSSNAVSTGRSPLSRSSILFSFPNSPPVGVALSIGLILSFLALGLPQLLSRRAVPVAGTVPLPASGQGQPLAPTASLRLEARGAQSWVLVERLGGGTVLDAILEPGQSKVLPLGQGLKIRSGRPDLLYVTQGASSPKRLGSVSDLNWVAYRPKL